MKISPITNQNYNTSFQAVNMKYYNKAKKIYEKYAPYHDLGNVLEEIELENYYDLISSRDAIDTLNAIKPFSQSKQLLNTEEWIDSLIEKFQGYINQGLH